MGVPFIPNIEPVLSAGFNPKTGLPIKFGSNPKDLKLQIKKALRIVDEQDAINRYRWYNLPDTLDGQLLERILYYKGQGAFFYMETDQRFYFLPYALNGSIDVYGRFTSVTALPFNGTSRDSEEKAWITGLSKKPKYEIQLELTPDTIIDGCVLLSDYSKQYSQTNISRQLIQDPILDVMSDCFPFMRTSLLNSTGVKAMRVNGEDEQSNVKAASLSVEKAALEGDPWIPIVGPVEFQDLNMNGIGRSEEYLMAMQSLDNFRLSLYGLDSGGIFQKKSHMLESEQEMNQGNVGLIYQDGLTIRQKFCDIVNSIWGLGIWCDSSEIITNIDQDMDGEISESEEPTQTEPSFDDGGNASE